MFLTQDELFEKLECPLEDEFLFHKHDEVTHRFVFEHEGKFFEITYCQSYNEGIHFNDDMVEVVPVKKTITVYERKE